MKRHVSSSKGSAGSLLKRICIWFLVSVATVVLGRYVDQHLFRLWPRPGLHANLSLIVHDPSSACDLYNFQVIFTGSYQINKAHVVIQMPDRILDYRIAYAKLQAGGSDFVGPSLSVIHKAGGCELLTPQEHLSPNIQAALPYPNELVVDATDVQNPIVGELMLLRSDNLVQSNFHSEGFYDYEILGSAIRRTFSLEVRLNAAPLQR
jgi:hypothetical protein